jgi:hypothetical protein
MTREDQLSDSQRILVKRIREQIQSAGRAFIGDAGTNPDQVRVLQSLDVLERRGDELLLVETLSP